MKSSVIDLVISAMPTGRVWSINYCHGACIKTCKGKVHFNITKVFDLKQANLSTVLVWYINSIPSQAILDIFFTDSLEVTYLFV